MGGFFSSIFGGSNPTLNKNINKFGAVGDFGVGLGESDLTKSSNFYSDILSGDKTKQAQALASPISTIQNQKQQNLNTNAEFSPRSGGTAASNEMAKSKATGSISEMIASLVSGSAGALSAEGSNLLQQGTAAFQTQDQASQQQMENWSNSIFGGGLTTAVSAAESYGLGKISGLPAGGGGGLPNLAPPELTSFGPNEGAPPPDLSYNWMSQ